jgi:UDP-N-acetylglucosamine acyltransferase
LIHPSAIIDQAALVDEGARIGPYSIIGADVEIGAGTIIGPHVVLKGPTRIGKDNHIFQFCSIGEDTQDKKYHGEVTRLEIGDRNVIREYCTINRGTIQDEALTRIGNDNLFMAYTHIAHDCVVGNHVVMANAASLAGHVRVDDHVTLGGFTLVHQFCKLGLHSFSAMGSVISRDIPPFVLVGGQPTRPHGINSVGLERKGYSAETIRAIRKAYKLIYKSGLTLEDAIKSLDEMVSETPAISVMANFLKNTGRSIIR